MADTGVATGSRHQPVKRLRIGGGVVVENPDEGDVGLPLGVADADIVAARVAEVGAGVDDDERRPFRGNLRGCGTFATEPSVEVLSQTMT